MAAPRNDDFQLAFMKDINQFPVGDPNAQKQLRQLIENGDDGENEEDAKRYVAVDLIL